MRQACKGVVRVSCEHAMHSVRGVQRAKHAGMHMLQEQNLECVLMRKQQKSHGCTGELNVGPRREMQVVPRLRLRT